LALELWKRASSRRKRFYVFSLCFLLLIVITVSGTLTPLTLEEAKDLSKDLEQTQGDIMNMTVLSGTLLIFRNNFMISLLMFIPFFGPFFGGYVTHNTGVVIAAESLTSPSPVPPTLVLLVLFVFPFTWMEFIVYSLAFSESLWLSWSLIKHKGREELLTTLILILVCLLVLLAAAFIEMVLIMALSGT